jgi:acetoin utilization protein AcuB
MSKSIPTIQKYMTTNPHSIGKDQTLATAEKMMHQHRIRHLPVLEGGKLLGVISDRDVKFLETFKDVDASKVTLDSMYIDKVFSVEPDALLDEVCDVMAENKYGSAIVMSNNKLVGIFTWVDALRAMSELLKTRLSK